MSLKESCFQDEDDFHSKKNTKITAAELLQKLPLPCSFGAAARSLARTCGASTVGGTVEGHRWVAVGEARAPTLAATSPASGAR